MYKLDFNWLGIVFKDKVFRWDKVSVVYVMVRILL